MEKRGIVLLAERRAKQWINSSHKPNATDVVEALKKDGPCQCLTQNASVWNAKQKSENVLTTKKQRPLYEMQRVKEIGTSLV